MEKLTIVKIGGRILEENDKLHLALKQFTLIDGYKILVHGGGKLASQVSNQMGVLPKMIEGRRITDSDSLKVVQMVYAGLINSNIVAHLQSLNCNAMGMTGADGDLIFAGKRPVKKIDFGYVGDIKKVNTSFLTQLLQINIVPVICAITHDGKGQILNTNADTITAKLGIALSAENKFNVDLVFCFEKNGVLRDIEDNHSLIPVIDEKNYTELIENRIIADGMIPKIDNAFDALHKGVSNVFIKNYSDLGSNSGTRIHL